MAKLTITEALAEIKTIAARAQKKREGVAKYIVRDSRIRDPFESEGGSEKWVAGERQGLRDLATRHILIRTKIQEANLTRDLTVQGRTRTVSEWLTWRREVAQSEKEFMAMIANSIQITRNNLQSKGGRVVTQAVMSQQVNLEKDAPVEAVVSVDEMANLKEMEHMELVLGELDGKLSLFNATTTIDL
jgi:hypothetical protein